MLKRREMNNHNREKNYYETRALLTLERLNLFETGYLVKSERPDFISADGKYGVEVTRTVYEEDAVNNTIFEKNLKGKSFTNVRKDLLRRFYSNGATPTFTHNLGLLPPNVFFGYAAKARWFSTNQACNTIKKKFLHINHTPYQESEILNLYVFSESFRDYELHHIRRIIDEIKKETYNRRFNTIYFDDCGWFYECNLDSDTIRFFDTQAFLHDICVEAKAFVDKDDVSLNER